MSTSPATSMNQPVWDRFVRLFHWSLVSCVVLNQFVLEAGETLQGMASAGTSITMAISGQVVT